MLQDCTAGAVPDLLQEGLRCGRAVGPTADYCRRHILSLIAACQQATLQDPEQDLPHHVGPAV